jgi:tetratricopeptide (TPR) repeat protein
MKFTACLALLLVSLLPLVLLGQESLTERKLRHLIEEEKRILNGSRMADGSYDEEILARRFQGLVHQYDSFIHENPGFPVGFVAYARLLERIGQENAAHAMYLKANQLDPNIPLVKNQLGNYLAEEGKFAQALPYYLAAIELEPAEPLYHYQLGNLLHHFRDEFLQEEIFSRKVLDRQMLEAFGKAAELAPAQAAFSYRHAEAFYDLEEPRWEEALAAWTKLEEKAVSAVEKQTVYLHRANIAIKQGQPEAAREILLQVTEPVLARNKATLQQKLEVKE